MMMAMLEYLDLKQKLLQTLGKGIKAEGKKLTMSAFR